MVVARGLGNRAPVVRASGNDLAQALVAVAVMLAVAGVTSGLLVTSVVSGVGVTIVVRPREMRGLLATEPRAGSSAMSGLASSALWQSGPRRTRVKRTTAPARTVTIASSTASTPCSNCCARSLVRSIA